MTSSGTAFALVLVHENSKTKRKSKMNNTLMNVFNNVKKTRGASLAEFAVVAAMMGTMATVAAPKFSGVGAGAEKQKTLSNMDLIAQAASNFYNAASTNEKKGRFPGQDKYTSPVGGYDATSLETIDSQREALELALTSYTSYTNAEGSKWTSVFGKAHPDAPILEVNTDAVLGDDDTGPAGDGAYDGPVEWSFSFGGDVIASPFQDGHYIYTVIPGYGAEAPTLYVADLVNPSEYNTSLKP